MKRHWKLLGAVFVCMVGIVWLGAAGGLDTKSRVERQFHADLEELTQTAELVLAGQEAEVPSKWRDVSRFDDVVCFDYGGWGFGPSTRYWGVNYAADDRLAGFQGMSLEGAVPDGEGWLWEEDSGDNRCYVERLAPCWYYFEMNF